MHPWGLEVRVSGVLAQFHLFSLPTTLQGCRNRGEGRSPPYILADQLTLSQLGEQIMPATLLFPSRIFIPSYGPALPIPAAISDRISSNSGSLSTCFFISHSSSISLSLQR